MDTGKYEELINVYNKKSKDWIDFSALTLKNLQEVENAIDEAQSACKKIESTINHIQTLCKHPQAKSYLQICSLAYVEALVRYTGEFNVELNPEYQCTLTKDQTINYLEEQLSEQKCILNTYKTQKEQLERRLGFNFDEVDDIPNISDMPNEIASDKGIAFKHGSFFEIVENEDVPYTKTKNRISRIKKEKTQTNFACENVLAGEVSSLGIEDGLTSKSCSRNTEEEALAFLNLIEKSSSNKP